MDSFFIGAGGLLAGLAVGNPVSRRILRALWYRGTSLGQEKTKLVIVVRSDLRMSTGKIAAQSAHAAVMSYCTAMEKSPNLCKTWINMGQPKIVVKCDKPGEQALLKYVTMAQSKGIITSTVIDAGHTQVIKGTVTVAGIGPGPESLINQITGKLSIF